MRLLLALALGSNLLLLPANLPPAAAACRDVETTKVIRNILVTSVVRVCDSEQTAGTSNGEAREAAAAANQVATVDLAACLAAATLVGAGSELCLAGDRPELTPELVTAAFTRTPLPPSVLQVQPPNGRTLVNFDTNFFTEAAPFTRVVTLLDRRVELRVFPVEFTWHFDDGATLTTTSPGTPYPDLDVTHDYGRTGTYTPRVDTTYGANWRVAGGAWQRVAGTVSVEGEVVELEAVEARPTLVR